MHTAANRSATLFDDDATRSFLELLNEARSRLRRLELKDPDAPVLWSIGAQLVYLADLANGNCRDFSRLGMIKAGLEAVREIEGREDRLADLLHQISGRVDRERRRRFWRWLGVYRDVEPFAS